MNHDDGQRDPKPTRDDVERARSLVDESLATSKGVATLPARVAFEFARLRAAEREACIRDLYDEAATWNEGSGCLNHMEFAERRIRARWASLASAKAPKL